MRASRPNLFRLIRLLSLGAVLVWACGCSSGFRFFNAKPAVPIPEAAPSAPSLLGGVAAHPAAVIAESEQSAPDSSKATPLSVAVAQAFFVGEQLHVKVRLEAKTTVPPAQIVVSVLGLREGQVVEKHHQLVSQLLPDELMSRGQSLLVPFRLAAKDLSEYQVQCRWGNDAVQFASREQLDAQKAPPPVDLAADPEQKEEQVATAPEAVAETDLRTAEAPLPDETARAALLNPPIITPPLEPKGSDGKLELRDVELEEEVSVCPNPPCDRKYVLRARMLNNGPQPLTDLELGVGLAWAEGKSLPKPPADYQSKRPREEIVALKQLVLKSGESKKLKIKVDRAVPVVPGGAFLPYIRIVQAKAAL